MVRPDSIDDAQLLEAARRWHGAPDIDSLSSVVLERLTAERGIDFATAVLYDRLCRRTDVAELLSQYSQHRSWSGATIPAGRLAIVPGALYREHPQTGADGSAILREADRIGWRCELVPLASAASPRENGIQLCHWLRRQSRDPLVLVSLSKGGADVKSALAQPDAEETFDRVCGWISFGGILDGAPMVEWACSKTFARSWYRFVCWLGGYDFDAFQALRRNDSAPLSFPLRTLPHIQTIHVVGVPLRRHLSSGRARRWHRRMACWGPNDSVTLLADVIRWPGRVLPVWGTDHYWQDRWNARRLVPFLLSAASIGAQRSTKSA
jgi:hypothetical protein